MAWRKVTGVLAAAAAGLLLVAAPAFASGTIPIHSTQVPTTAGQFLAANTGDDHNACGLEQFTGGPLTRASDQDAWHFVLPAGNGADEFTDVTFDFKKPDNSHVSIFIHTVTDGSTFDDGGAAGWRGYLRSVGNPGRVTMIYLITPAGWELESGPANVTGTPDQDAFYTISSACAGTPPPPPPCPEGQIRNVDGVCVPPPCPDNEVRNNDGQCVPPPCTNDVAAVAALRCPTTPPATTTAPPLPTTGSSLTGILVGAVVLLGGGGTILLLARRRRSDGEGTGTPA